MKRNLHPSSIAVCKRILIAFALFIFTFLSANAQSPIYFSSGHYANPNSFTQGSAVLMGTIVGTNIHTTTPNGIGNQYFRFFSALSGGTTYEPNGGSDILLTSGAAPTALQVTGSGKAYYLNIANAASNVVFKTDGTGTPGSSRVYATEVQGTIRTVTAVTQSPVAGGVNSGQNVLVTATLSAALSTGQNVYIRYTNSTYAAATVAAMTVAGTTATFTIPAATNTASAVVSYYIFTSGATTPLNADADLSTINLNNNSGSNYGYTVGASTTTYTYLSVQTGVWNTGSTWVGGVVPPTTATTNILIGHNVTINSTLFAGTSATQSGKLTVDLGGTLTLAPGGTTLVNFTFGAGGAVNAGSIINGDYVQTNGTLTGGNGSLTFNGNVTLTGGVFNNQEYYGSTSVLIFNGIAPTTNSVWNPGTIAPAIASPYNVKVTANTTLPTLSGTYTCLYTFNIVTGSQFNTTNQNLTVGNLIGGGTYRACGNQTFTVGTDNTSTTFSGAYNACGVNNLTKVGTGILTLSGASNWNGITSIQNGALSIATLNNQIGSGTSNLGTPNSGGNGTINFGSTTTTGGLIFTGTTLSSDRIINLAGTTGGGYIQADGTGPLTLTGTNTATGAGVKTLTLQGTNTGNNTIGTIVNGSGTVSLVKAGAGTWVLNGSNTYTGATTVNAGILILGSSNAIKSGAAGSRSDVVLNGGTLKSGTSTGNTVGSSGSPMGTLTLSSSSTIALGTGSHSLFFAPSNGTWTGTLTITGWTLTAGVSGTAGKIFIGATTGTLTTAQLAQVTFSGYTAGAMILSTGELVPIATTFTTYYWIGGTSATTWQTASAWSLTPGGVAVGSVTVSAGSIFIFDGNNIITGGGTGNINVTNSTAAIDVAQVILQNNANVTYTPGTNNFDITIQGSAGVDFSITSGSTFSFGSKNYAITMAGGAVASIDGNVYIGVGGAQTHQLIGTSAGSITFNSTSTCTLNTSSGVIPFGSGTTGSVIFNSGARLVGIKNGDPFGGTGITVLTLNPGSIYEYQSGSNTYMPFALSSTARTYGIVEISVGGLGVTSTQDVTLDTLKVTSAATSASTIIFPGGGTLNINGNLDNYSTKAFGLIGNNTSTISNINFNGSGNQYILNRASAIGSGGGITFGESSSGFLTNINFNNGATIFLGNGVDLGDCQLISSLAGASKTTMTVYSGTTLDMRVNVVYGKDATHGGTFITQSGSTLKMGSTGGIALVGAATGNAQTQVRTFDIAGNYEYNGVATPQVTGTALPATVNDLTINNSASSGIVQYTNSAGSQINGLLYLKAATLDINSKTITMKGNGTTNSIIVTGARSITNSNAAEGLIDIPSTATNLTVASSSGTSLSVGTKVEVRTAKGVDFRTNFTTLNDTFRIKSGGYVSGSAPYYSSTSTLVYDCGCNYASISSTSKEWYDNTFGTSAGVPNDVMIKAASSLNFSTTNFVHEMRGSLYIGETAGSASTFALSTGTGDLNIGGNWIRNQQGIFTHNNNRVYFNGATGTQTIKVTGGGTETFSGITITKSGGGNVQLITTPNLTNIASAKASGDVIQFLYGGLDLNGDTLTLSGTGGNIDVENGVRTITGAANSTVLISGSSGTISKTVTNSSGGSLVSDVNVKIKITTGADFGYASGTPLTTINGSLEMGPNAYVNSATSSAPFYGSSSTLIYNTSSNFTSINTNTKEWYENTFGSNAGVPNNVIIKSGSSLNFSNTAYPHEMRGSLTIGEATGSSSTLSLSTVYGGDLNVGGNWTRNVTGLFVHNDREVIFNNSTDATLTVNATGGTENFAYVELNKSTSGKKLTMASHITVTDRVKFTKGTLDLGSKFFSILSTSSKTAQVGVSNKTNTSFMYGSGSTGQFIAQRYVPAKRAWRLVSPPVSGANATISQAWQEGPGRDYSTSGNASTSIAADSILTNFAATLITGNAPNNTTTQGFDVGGSSVKASILYYNKSVTPTVWTAPSATSALVKSQRGWMLFIRGDRKTYGQIDNAGHTPTVTTLRPRGEIFIGDTTFTGTGMTVIGNPYASSLDFHAAYTASSSSFGDAYYIWDPNMGGANNVGAFVNLSAYSGGSYTRSAPLTGTGSSSIDNVYIPSGAAVIVDFGSGGSITFHESDKVVPSSTIAYRTIRNIRTTLNAVEPDGSTVATDGVINLFDNAYDTAVKEKEDVLKLTNIEGENFSTKRNNILLTVEKRKLLQANDTIFYNWSKVKVKQYQLEISADSLQKSWTELYLEDRYKNSSTAVPVTDTTRYNFNIVKTDSGTFRADRFRLIMKYNPPVVNSIKAWQQYNDVAVEWNIDNVKNIQQFIIERSDDGISFLPVGEIESKDITGKNTYNWLDTKPLTGNNFYRIHGVGEAGQEIYSAITKITIAQPGIAVYPNPVTNGVVGLQLTNMPKGNYGIALLNDLGQTIAKKQLNYLGGDNTVRIPLATVKIRGIYQVQVVLPDQSTSVIKVIY